MSTVHPIFVKLNYKAQTEIAVLNAPGEFLTVLDTMAPLATISTDAADIQTGAFAMVFVKTQQEVTNVAQSLAPKLTGDAILWLAYPKGSSKKYKCDFNRDTGWASLGALGFEPVRMVALDDDWSALRFRRAEYIKKMMRQESGAISEQGKAKVRRDMR